ncbi:MFS transporter [Estrella lausannensis]|uniref:Major facilitator superfamily (MFS) profile domain-containing protein n=1 Tax=Estrella lausannensis TaxID=483423 RepID=A0A0H5E622_9BACT|nr:MFS transporter [Estrella lausannensis]CRX38700.1 hypothetical protein ELAC_1362 [Estrella lausannensis]
MFNKETKYLFLIISIFIAACIETDIFLPAMTDMMIYFSVGEDMIQSLLTWNFVGICISCPLYGPLSDAFGRKRPLLIALGLFLVGSILTTTATGFNMMLFGRVLQGLGSGGCFTLGTAIIFDSFQEEKAILAINRINSIVPFIMAGAPMLGGYLNYTFGFRSNFVAIAIVVMGSLSTSLFLFKETLPENARKPFNMRKVASDFKTLSLSIPFWQAILVVCLTFAGYLAFLSTVSVLYVIELGVSKDSIPAFQAALLGTWLIANLACGRAIAKWGAGTVKKTGTALFTAGGVGLLTAAWAAPKDPYLLTGAMTFYSFGANWINSTYFPEGMSLFPDIKGTAASFLTSARLLIAALVVGLASTLYDGSIYPIALIVFTISAVNFLIICMYESRKNEGLAEA